MSEALRFNEGKPSLAYILQFANPIKAIARIMEFGATKYADGNWRKGGKPDREYLDSMMRHLTLWIHGEKYDKDSGCSHLGHAIWNLMALHELNHPDEIIDDEVFKRQCAHWKAKKEESVIPAEYCDDAPPLQKNAVVNEIKLPGIWQLAEVRKWGQKVKAHEDEAKFRDIEAKKEEGVLEIPATHWVDVPALQKNPFIMGPPDVLRLEGWEVQKGETPLKCPECGSPPLCATWECDDCGWWEYHADSGLTKKIDSSEKQKEEEGLQEDDIEITFVIPNDTRCKSFEALVKEYIRPALIRRALEYDVQQSKAHSTVFEHWGSTPNVARPSTKKKKKVTPRHPQKDNK